MEWLILALLIVMGVESNAQATLPTSLEPPLPQMQRAVEILPSAVETSRQNRQPIQPQSITKVAAVLPEGEIIEGAGSLPSPQTIDCAKFQSSPLPKEGIAVSGVGSNLSISHQGPNSKSEPHKITVDDLEFVLMGPAFEEFLEAARQVEPPHLVLALRYIRNSQTSSVEIIEMIMNWPPKKLEGLLTEQMQQEFDLLVKALQKLPRDYLLRGISFIRASKETSGQLAKLLTR